MMLKRSPLKRSAKLKTKKRLPSIGRRKRVEIRETSAVRHAYLDDHPRCEIGAVLESRPSDTGVCLYGARNCTGTATCVHERKKRSQGGSLVDPANLMAACAMCNAWVEWHPYMARSIGVSVLSSDDPGAIPVLRCS